MIYESTITNTGLTDTRILLALVTSNSAYIQANTATGIGQSSFTQANTALSIAQGAYSTANTKFSANGGTINGSVIVTQDLTINGNVYIGGNTITLSSNNLSISDSLIYMAQENPANLNDIGIVGHFTSTKYQHTGLVRDHTDGIWKLFSNVATEPSTTIDFTTAIYDSLKVGTVIGNLYGNANTVTNGIYSTDTGTVTSAMIADGTIVNGDISSSAAIATNKLAANTISGIYLGSNLNNLSNGSGLIWSSGSNYNGSAVATLAIDASNNSPILSTSATQTLINKTFQAYTEKVYTVGSIATATYNLDMSLANIFDLTLGANVTLTFINVPAAGNTRPITLIVRQPSVSPGKTLTVTGAKYTDGVVPILSANTSAIDVLTYWSIDGGTTHFGTFAMANIS